ncbi:hypothetical protein IJJ97_07375, partial [bacterium]|nr:hypothetical protein [bacterium]
MKCEKCGAEISKIIGFCTKCEYEEAKQKALEEGIDIEKDIIDLLRIGTFGIRKNTKTNTMSFIDDHFSPKFDYKNKPIDTIKICMPLCGIFVLCSIVSFIYFFNSLFNNGISPLTISLPFVFAFLAWLSFYIAFNFNPSVNLGIWEINKEGFLISYIDPKSKKENKQIKIDKYNISSIEIREISDIKNEYILSPAEDELDKERHNNINENQENDEQINKRLEEINTKLEKEKKEGYYTLYIHLSNGIYIDN